MATNRSSSASPERDPGGPPYAEKISGTGEMAELIRARDWAKTVLGPLEDWPENLIQCLNTILASRFPMAIAWGPEMIQFYNDAYSLLFAEKHPEALGKPAAETWKEAWHIVGPQLEAALVRGEAIYRENVVIPVVRRGQVQNVYWTYSNSPIYGSGGEIAGILSICHDVTGEVLASRERDAFSEQLRQVLEATTDAVVCLTRNWRISYMNPRAQEIAAPEDQLLGTNLWKVIPRADYPGSPLREHLQRAMYEGKSGEFEGYYPEPLNLWIEAHVRPTTDGIVVFFRDTTEQRRTEAALKESEKLAAVGRLAASIAHEVNNPLEALTNLLYLALEASDMRLIRRYLQDAERELRRVSLISNQTLRFYRQSTNPTLVHSDELFENVLASQQGRIMNAQIHAEKEFRAKAPLNCFDGEIRQVLSNLIGNAIDAMRGMAGGRLLVRSREGTQWQTGRKGLLLTVADTGHGIDRKHLAKIFEPFFSTKGIGGTGLGLWVSQEIVMRHLGTLRVRSSKKKGHAGTVFVLFLPFDGVDRAMAA